MKYAEVNVGSKIYYSQPTGDCYSTLFKNGRRYFVSKVNVRLNNKTSIPLRNGEPFVISKIEEFDLENHESMVYLNREIDNTCIIARVKDLQYFSCKRKDRFI